jgi:poly(A) polymerase
MSASPFHDDTLRALLACEVPMQDESERQARRSLVEYLKLLCQTWARDKIRERLGYEVPLEQAAQLHLSGSEPTGLDESGIDIDACVVFPNVINRNEFFSSMSKHLASDATVTNVQVLASAAVPMIGFEVHTGAHKIDIDLLVGIIGTTPLPPGYDVHSDEAILQCIDEASERSLGGPRTTEAILRAVPDRRVFIDVLRAVRLWARRRQLYSNKAGFLGGINLSLLAAHAACKYPDAPAARVLERFFWLYKEWTWPTPVSLRPPKPCVLPAARSQEPLAEWCARGQASSDVMPILTPAFPATNSSPLVTPQSLAVIKEEMAIAHDQVSRFLASPAPLSNWIPHTQSLPARPSFSELPTIRGKRGRDSTAPEEVHGNAKK